MSKAWCIWCETGGRQSSSGLYWIHDNCAAELMEVSSDLRTIKEMLRGNHPRNKTDEDRIKVVVDFIKDMENFKRRWENSMKAIKEVNRKYKNE